VYRVIHMNHGGHPRFPKLPIFTIRARKVVSLPSINRKKRDLQDTKNVEFFDLHQIFTIRAAGF